jgi:hypothetical protein
VCVREREYVYLESESRVYNTQNHTTHTDTRHTHTYTHTFTHTISYTHTQLAFPTETWRLSEKAGPWFAVHLRLYFIAIPSSKWHTRRWQDVEEARRWVGGKARVEGAGGANPPSDLWGQMREEIASQKK